MDGPGQSEEGTVFDQLYVYLSIESDMKENLCWLTAGAVVLGFILIYLMMRRTMNTTAN